MSKIDIDILVELLLYGPAGSSERWWGYHEKHGPTNTAPPAGVGTALGRTLYLANAEQVLDPEYDEPLTADGPVLGYTFERVPFPVTAVEGLKLVGCYRYQTAGDDWNRSEPARICRWLQANLIGRIPGYDDAPWGWDTDAVNRRMDLVRASPTAHSGDPVPAGVEAQRVLDVFRAHGVEVEPYTGREDDDIPRDLRYVPAGGPYGLTGHWASGNYLNQGHVHVRQFADDAAAHDGFLIRRRIFEHNTERPAPLFLYRVQRHGRIVADLARGAAERDDHVPSDMPLATRAQQEAAFAALGEPDEAWSSEDPPIWTQRDSGTVLATRLALPLGSGGTIVDFATDDEALRRIAALVDDNATRDRILATDLEQRAVAMIVGVGHADAVTGSRMVEIAAPPDEGPWHRWEFTVEGLRFAPAVVVAVDRPPHRPNEALLHFPESRTPISHGVNGEPS